MATSRKFLFLAAILLLAMAGCAGMGDDDSESAGADATATAEPDATLPMMQIVTPTPVDPRQIPGTATEVPEDVSVPETYVVKEGDSLYSIAAQFQIALADIVALNGLSDPNDISVGQELRLPVPEQP